MAYLQNIVSYTDTDIYRRHLYIRTIVHSCVEPRQQALLLPSLWLYVPVRNYFMCRFLTISLWALHFWSVTLVRISELFCNIQFKFESAEPNTFF